MYPHLAGGEGGEPADSGLFRARQVQMEGIAKPTASPFADNRPPARGPEQPWDSARYQPPEGYTVHEPSMREFDSLARDLGYTQRQAEAGLALHHKLAEAGEKARSDALATQRNDWQQETQRHFGDRLPEVADDIKAAVGSDADAAEFFRALKWSDLEVNPSVLRVLHRLSNGGRRW
jgi:hypothetical protein